MTKLDMQQAPKAWVPRLFLVSASLWGVLAGVLMAWQGEALLASRWNGAALAVVHAFTLGVLANAMFGSLLQFLPVAAAVRVRGGHRVAHTVFALLNSGALALVVAFAFPKHLSPVWGGVLLLGAFVLLAAMLVAGLRKSAVDRFLRQGIACAVMAAVVTACFGMLLVLGLAGVVSSPLFAVTDVHASWGVLGWVLGLLAAVSRVVAPMFQGVPPMSSRAQGIWQAACYTLLLLSAGLVWKFNISQLLRIGVGLAMLAFAVAGLLLQLRSPRLRKAPLTYFWMAGLASLAVGALLLLVEPARAMWVGGLVLVLGLPLLVTGMQLEIIAFLGWIELQRRCGRGVHLPGVQLLVPQRDKAVVLALHLLAACLLLLALGHQIAMVVAGIALVIAHLSTFIVLLGPNWRAWQFVSALEKQRSLAEMARVNKR